MDHKYGMPYLYWAGTVTGPYSPLVDAFTRRYKQDTKNPISGNKIIEEMDQKISRLKRPKGFSCRPILIHANGVHEHLIDADYFANIIDFSQIFDEK